MSHVLRHNVTGHRGRGAEHDKRCDELLSRKAHMNSKRKENSRKTCQLQKGSAEGRFYFPEHLSEIHGGTHGKKSHRRSKPPDITKRGLQKFRHGKLHRRKKEAEHDSENNRVGDDPDQGFPKLASCQFLSLSCRQDQNRCHIVQRHAAEHHKSTCGGSPVNHLDIGHSKKGCTAPVGALDKLRTVAFFREKVRQKRCRQNRRQRGCKAKQDIAPIPLSGQINVIQLSKKTDRQSNLKHKFVHLGSKGIADDPQLPERPARHHNQKDRKCCIQRKNQIRHTGCCCYPFIVFSRNAFSFSQTSSR